MINGKNVYDIDEDHILRLPIIQTQMESADFFLFLVMTKNESLWNWLITIDQKGF